MKSTIRFAFSAFTLSALLLSARAQLLYVDTTTNQTINGVPIVGDPLTNAFGKLNYDLGLLSTNIGGNPNVTLTTNAAAILTVPTIVVTNLTLTTTSPAPGSTTPVVWFLFTNAGQAYKVGGCQ